MQRCVLCVAAVFAFGAFVPLWFGERAEARRVEQAEVKLERAVIEPGTPLVVEHNIS